MVNQTVVTLVDRADAPTLVVTAALEPLAGGLKEHVSDRLAQLKRAAPGWLLVAQRDAKANGMDAIVVEATVSAGRAKRGLRQIYAHDATNARVIVVTVSAQESTDKRA